MTGLADALAPVKALLSDEAKDLRLNLGSVIERSSLTLEEAVGCALAAAVVARSIDLVEAFQDVDELPAEQAAGARTAAALLAMNTTWYPYVDMADDPELATQPAGLRMQAYANHAGIGAERFELYALAAAIVGKCHRCISAHVAELRKHGRTTEQLRDVGRISATVLGVATALDTMAVATA